jgi:hypothetical protein
MARKEDDKRKVQKKLTLNKATIRDLTTRKEKADVVRGGANTMRRCA